MTLTPTTDNYGSKFAKYTNVDGSRALRQQALDKINTIRKDPTLTDYGRRIEIARIYRDTRHTLDRNRAELHTGIANETRELTRMAFSSPDTTPAGIIAHRDARERATKLTTKAEAQAAIDIAHLDGDLSLARAIAHHAYNHHWNEVVDAHTQAHPGTADTLDALHNLPTSEAARTAEGNIFGIPAPKELGSLDPTADALPHAERIIADAEGQ